MPDKLVMLDYTFVFNPAKGWSNLYQFEGQLYDFFESKGFDVLPLTMAKGQSGRSGCMLVPKEQVQVPEKQAKPGDIQKNINKLRQEPDQPRVKDGKYASK